MKEERDSFTKVITYSISNPCERRCIKKILSPNSALQALNMVGVQHKKELKQQLSEHGILTHFGFRGPEFCRYNNNIVCIYDHKKNR